MSKRRYIKKYNNNKHNPKDLEKDFDGDFKTQTHMTMAAGKLGFKNGSINNTKPKFGKKGMDMEPPSRTGGCGSIKCTATGTKVFKFYHVTKHRNKDKYYCMTCVQKFRDMGKKRAKKHRDKFGKTKNNTINTVPLILPEIHLHFQKLNLPENPSPLFHMDKHQLFRMSTEVSYQILSTGQKLISAGDWIPLCTPRWTTGSRGFASYKTWGLMDGDNNWMLALSKAMKVGDKSVEIKVLKELINHVKINHTMNEVFVKVGLIKTIQETQQVRSIFGDVLIKADSQFSCRCRTVITL